MWFCLILIGCYLGMCALQRPFADQGTACSVDYDADDDDSWDFLDESVKIDYSAVPGHPDCLEL